jgi:hypothetical protein
LGFEALGFLDALDQQFSDRLPAPTSTRAEISLLHHASYPGRPLARGTKHSTDSGGAVGQSLSQNPEQQLDWLAASSLDG